MLGVERMATVVKKTIQWLVEHPGDGSLLLLVSGGKFLAGGEQGSDVFPVELPAYYLACIR